MRFHSLIALGLERRRMLVFWTLSLAAAFFESFGMAMFVPVLEYIEKGQDILVLSEMSAFWRILAQVFHAMGVHISFSVLVGLVLCLLLLRVGFMYLRQVYAASLAQDVLHKTRTRLFRTYAAAEYGYFDDLATGSVVNLATTETQRLEHGIRGLLALAANGVVIAAFVAALAVLSPLMTVMVVVFLGGSGLVVSWFVRKTRSLSRENTTRNKRFSELLVERLAGLRLVKLSGAEQRETRQVEEASAQVRDRAYQLQALRARVDLLLEPLIILLGAVLLFVAVNGFRMTLARVGVFMLILLRMLPLCKEFLRLRQQYLANAGALEAIENGLAEAESRREDPGGAKRFTGLEKGVEFKDVDFTYPGRVEPALEGVDVFIPAHGMTALVGPSGAGKSTLADLLAGLRVPDSGSILLDGVDIREFSLESLRASLAFVSQDAVIFNDTVLANLAFASPAPVSETEAWKALSMARAREFVRSLPQGLDTVLGERGIKLSGGQRQRISLARALLKNAPLLILDEPTSALDSELEQDVHQAMKSLLEQGATILVIAHRLSTIKRARRIVVLDAGRVREAGTHEELRVNRAWYENICGLQKV